MNKKKAAPIVVLVAIAVTALGLAAAVYAKYVSRITRTGSATVAKWAFTEDNSSEGTVTCELDRTYNTNTLVDGKIAPGTSGYCPIEISNANTEVAVDFEIAPSTVTNQPENLKFYTDAAHQNEITGSTKVTGRLLPNAANTTTVNVYWNWAYEDGTYAYDTKDTADGATGSTMTITFDVIGTQVQPTPTN